MDHNWPAACNTPCMQLATFYDPVALVVVVGGTLVATVLRSPSRDAVRGVRALMVLRRRRFSAEPLLRQVATLSRIAQRHGAHALDRTVITDPDIALAVAAIVDGASAVEVEAIVRASRGSRIERHVAVAEMWAAAADAAPAMGMVGTLIGLARMFADMQDVTAIGAGMAVALLATLYGALLANFILAPIAARLRAAGRAEALERVRLDAPLVALAERETPRLPHGLPLQSVA